MCIYYHKDQNRCEKAAQAHEDSHKARPSLPPEVALVQMQVSIKAFLFTGTVGPHRKSKTRTYVCSSPDDAASEMITAPASSLFLKGELNLRRSKFLLHCHSSTLVPAELASSSKMTTTKKQSWRLTFRLRDKPWIPPGLHLLVTVIHLHSIVRLDLLQVHILCVHSSWRNPTYTICNHHNFVFLHS